jgi:L-histidine N-alpha-methyltransferase
MIETFESAEFGRSQVGTFRADVLAGLALVNKSLPSRWLYDEHGCELFEQISQLESYYPARAEAAILRYYRTEIARFMGAGATIIEYGACAGAKTEVLLGALLAPAAYVPVDFMGGFLGVAVHRVSERFPNLPCHPVAADALGDFTLPNGVKGHGPRVVFFPGSGMGHLDTAQAIAFMQRLHARIGPQGTALIGFDLLKDMDMHLSAHSDRGGINAALHLNLLARINRELGADFPVKRFMHEARWNAEQLAIDTHLVSLDRCAVDVAMRRFKFECGESIHTESARKYTVAGIHDLATKTGWRVEQAWTDRARRFAVIGLRACDVAPA